MKYAINLNQNRETASIHEIYPMIHPDEKKQENMKQNLKKKKIIYIKQRQTSKSMCAAPNYYIKFYAARSGVDPQIYGLWKDKVKISTATRMNFHSNCCHNLLLNLHWSVSPSETIYAANKLWFKPFLIGWIFLRSCFMTCESSQSILLQI